MDNETKEVLNLILSKMTSLEEGQQEITQRLDKLEQGQSKLEQVTTNIAVEVSSIKKDTAITRVAVNELVSWTDTAANIIDVPFMKAK